MTRNAKNHGLPALRSNDSVHSVIEENHHNGSPMTRITSTMTQKTLGSVRAGELNVVVVPTYRLYRRRFLGLFGLANMLTVMLLSYLLTSKLKVLLNIVAPMAFPWFGPISNNMATDLDITLDEINWIGNIGFLIFLPSSLVIPSILSKYGIRRCCDIGAVMLILSAWIRFAGTVRSLPPKGAYALLMLGQCFSAIAQPMYQVIGPKYSETWFDLKGRTTATMIIAISNPVGGALGQLLSPVLGDTRHSILVLAIISTAVVPAIFLIKDKPPLPPTYAGSKSSPPLTDLLRAIFGLSTSQESYMSVPERIDFAILALIFGVIAASTNVFGILSGQIMQPMGYSADQSGFMGACLLLTGIVAAIVTAPLFDRVFTHRLALTAKVLIPVVAAAWLSLIWAVTPHNLGGLFAIMTIIGVCSITMLPVGLELGCELTRNADGSSAILWFLCYLLALVFVLVEGALRAGPDASPPLNMRRALIFNGATIVTVSSLVFFLKGIQARRRMDESKLKESDIASP